MIREALHHVDWYAYLTPEAEVVAALDALVAERDEGWYRANAAEAERDEYKQAAYAEAFIADEFRARLIAAKTVMPDWTPEGWDAFIEAALAPSATGGDS